jgi:hypothetical protein
LDGPLDAIFLNAESWCGIGDDGVISSIEEQQSHND